MGVHIRAGVVVPHNRIRREYEKQAQAKQIPKTPVTQLTVSEMFRRLEPYSRDSKRWRDITVAVNCMPLFV